MPGLSGVELQSRLIADGRLMPIIGVTAYPEESIRTQMLRAGAIGFLSKPFNDECLIDCLTTALKGTTANLGALRRRYPFPPTWPELSQPANPVISASTVKARKPPKAGRSRAQPLAGHRFRAGTTQQALIAEGLNYVLAKYKKPAIAKVKS